MKHTLFNRHSAVSTLLLLMVSLVSLLLISCGGGGGGGGGASNDFAGGGISGTGVSSGAITGFGSIILNESTYTVTGSTAITVNGVSGLTQNDLNVGMVALVNFSNGAATSIFVDNELKGLVDSVNAANNTLTVMGTVVTVDNSTVFRNMTPANLSGITAGQYAEIHGLFDFSGNTIRATSVEKISQPAAGQFEVKGTVSDLDTQPGTFRIGTLLVNYINNNVLPSGTVDGSFVEVKGDLTGGILIAASIEHEDEVPGLDPNDEFEIEGIVSSLDNPNNPTQIVINGKTVLLTAQTIYESGDIADLKVGIKAEAEGSLNGSGTLIATKIKFRDSVKIEATVDTVGATTLTIFGSITVRALSSTRYDGGLTGFGDIQANDYLEISGYPDGASSVVALEIERETDPGRSILQGPVQSIANPNLVILGIPVQTDGATDFEINDAVSSAGIFFSTVQTGNIVKAKEDPTDGTPNVIDAKEVDLEGND